MNKINRLLDWKLDSDAEEQSAYNGTEVGGLVEENKSLDTPRFSNKNLHLRFDLN